MKSSNSRAAPLGFLLQHHITQPHVARSQPLPTLPLQQPPLPSAFSCPGWTASGCSSATVPQMPRPPQTAAPDSSSLPSRTLHPSATQPVVTNNREVGKGPWEGNPLGNQAKSQRQFFLHPPNSVISGTNLQQELPQALSSPGGFRAAGTSGVPNTHRCKTAVTSTLRKSHQESGEIKLHEMPF